MVLYTQLSIMHKEILPRHIILYFMDMKKMGEYHIPPPITNEAVFSRLILASL